MNTLIFFRFLWFLIIVRFGQASDCPRWGFRRNEALKKRQITDHALWSKSGIETVAECSTKCANDKDCVSFFFSKEKNNCIGHTVQFYSTEPGIVDADSVYYTLDVGEFQNFCIGF